MKMRGFLANLLATGTLSLLAACGGGGETGTGGGTSSSDTTTSSSTTTTTTTTSTGATSACSTGDHQLHLLGSAGTMDLTADYPLGASLTKAPEMEASFGDGGLLDLRGGRTLLLLPKGSAAPGEVIHADAATVGGGQFHLSSLSVLGACPGPGAVMGDLSFCKDTNQTCANGAGESTTGTMSGAAFDWSGGSGYQFYDFNDSHALVVWENGAVLFGTHDGTLEGGTFTAGFLWMASSGADADSVWCIESGGFSNVAHTTNLQVSLARLAAPQEASATTGSLDGCY
jgi:hypothetical protein